MPDNILIIASRYDAATFYTSAWARHLHDDLMRRGLTCLLLDAEALCGSGSTLSEALDRVGHVVFFGHGHADKWIALPPQSGTSSVAELPLVETSTIQILDGKQVYAGCCHSLAQLGHDFANRCTGHYVGYSQQFQFETANHQRFRDIVIHSVVGFVTGLSAQTVTTDLAAAWDRLAQDFTAGPLSFQPNAIMAAMCADDNRQRIGHLP